MDAFISPRIDIGLHGDLCLSGLSALFFSAFLFVISYNASSQKNMKQMTGLDSPPHTRVGPARTEKKFGNNVDWIVLIPNKLGLLLLVA